MSTSKTQDIKRLRQFAIYDVPDPVGAFIAGKTRFRELEQLAPIKTLGEVDLGKHVQLHPHQLFARNFVNTHTPFPRLFLNWSTGFGKTIAMLGTAMRFLQETGPDSTVLVLGFTKEVFQNELLRRPQFGFVTAEEVLKTQDLRQKAMIQSEAAQNRFRDWMMSLRRRLVSRKGNGRFQFFGWKRFTNLLFGGPLDPKIDSEEELRRALKEGSVKFNDTMLAMFRDTPLLVLGDEIPATYNSRDKNMWGVALQMAMDQAGPHFRAIFVSATPINNHAAEVVDLLNLLVPGKTFSREDFFDGETLHADGKKKLAEAFRGRVSYLFKVDPESMPRKQYLGKERREVPRLRFTETRMTSTQQKVFDKMLGETGSLQNTLILDAAVPVPGGAIAETPADLKSISQASPEWKKSNGLEWVDGTVGGRALGTRLKEISPKYAHMVELMHEGVSRQEGKYFLYHPDVHGTGVLFIGEVLRNNGFIEIGQAPTNNTICALCGKTQARHKDKHKFSPARFAVAHGEIAKRDLTRILDLYNIPDNVDGSRLLVLVGSRMMGEAHDLKAIRNLWVLKRPDSIPALLQIIGRGVRRFSHAALPRKDWVVRVRLFTSVMHDGSLGYAQKKYQSKMESFAVIQEVQKIMHEMSVDYFLTKDATTVSHDDPLGPLPYRPRKDATVLQKFPALYPYYADDVAETVLLLKRLFAEQSPAWKYKDLLEAVRHPPKSWNVTWNTQMVSEEVFAAALAQMCPPSGFEVVSEFSCDYWNPQNVTVCVRGAQFRVQRVGDTFVLARYRGSEKARSQFFDLAFRGEESEATKVLARNISVDEYVKTIPMRERYERQRVAFVQKYESREDLSEAVCENDTLFQEFLMKEVVQRVQNAILNKRKRSPDPLPLEFSVRMLFYYNALGLVVWAAQVPDEYPRLDRKRTKAYKSVLVTSRKGCPDWCPPKVFSKMQRDIRETMNLITGKLAPERIPACMVPAGISFKNKVEIFKNGAWDKANLEFPMRNWKENDLIVGYDEKTEEGLGVMKFKVRAPLHQLEKHKDLRKMERGAICSSRPKKELGEIMKKLNIAGDFGSIVQVCSRIRSEIIRREIEEREKGSNVKWFYNHYEDLPQ